MAILEQIRQNAAKNIRTIVLPESEDKRTIDAVDKILNLKIAKIILIAKDDIRSKITAKDQSALTIIDPETFKDIDKVSSDYYELRKAKGMTPEEARNTMLTDYLAFGAMLVKENLADGFVAGASHTTADVIRAGLRSLSVDRSISVVSGSFLMEIPNCQYGDNGVILFADCGVNPDPNARQLSGIALASALLFKQLTGTTPRVAFLSYSTKGSAEGPLINKMRDALAKTRELAPDLLIDGELQGDSALVQEVANIKCPGSPIGGKANVLIFPDLNSGNICYKLTQRLAKARAIGPLLMGFTKPCSDLSRGCSADDIVDAVAITAVRV